MKAVFYGIFFTALVLICVIAVKSYCKKLFSGCCGGGGNKAVRARKAADRNPLHYPFMMLLEVDGMVCTSCANTVANALNALPGVWAAVDLGKGRATVRMKERLPSDTLRRTVSAAGPYTVLRVEEKVGRPSENRS